MKIDIYSGFLGAGKTTLIKKMIAEAHKGEKLVLIENEFGQIGIDAGFLQDAGIQITEMNSGCICCSLVGDFGKALHQVIDQYAPDRIIIEPSGVGKLSDVIAAVEKVTDANVTLGATVAVVDATKVKSYMRNFGEFYNNQVETATTIVLSRTDSIAQEKLDAAVALLREHNDRATLVTTPWDQLTGAQLKEAMEGKASLAAELAALVKEHEEDEEHEHHHHHDHEDEEHEHHHHHDHEDEEHEHHHHHDHEDEEHEHHHHHDHEDEEHEHHHHDHEDEEHEHHHHHDHEDEEHEHHHHHDHGEECGCGCHDHHHHHHADEVFTSWGVETAKKFTKEQIQEALKALDAGSYGVILRAKGIVAAQDGGWIHFDHVPGEADVRSGSAAVTGKLCVIGSQLNEKAVAELFGV